MVKILELRSFLRVYYQKFQLVLDPIWKFIVAFVTLSMVNSTLHYEERLEKTVIVALISVLCAFTPSSVLVFFAMAFSIVHVLAVSPLMAIIVFVMFIILYCFFLRFAPQYGYAVVAIPILYTYNVPYLVPILLGLFTNPISMLPAACGVIVYYMFAVIKNHVSVNTSVTTDDVLPFYTEVFEDITSKKEILVVALVFALVIVAVHVVRRMKMSFASEIAILAGAVVNVFGFLISDLKFGATAEISKMIVGTLLSVLLAFVALFFKRVFDYAAVENVQFEDDDYYYYVKAVPKIEIGLQERSIKKISEKNMFAEEDEEDDEDDVEEILNEETGEVVFRSKKKKGGNHSAAKAQDINFIPEKFRRKREDLEQRTVLLDDSEEFPQDEKDAAADESGAGLTYEEEKKAAKEYEQGIAEEYLTEEDLMRMNERAYREDRKED